MIIINTHCQQACAHTESARRHSFTLPYFYIYSHLHSMVHAFQCAGVSHCVVGHSVRAVSPVRPSPPLRVSRRAAQAPRLWVPICTFIIRTYILHFEKFQWYNYCHTLEIRAAHVSFEVAQVNFAPQPWYFSLILCRTSDFHGRTSDFKFLLISFNILLHIFWIPVYVWWSVCTKNNPAYL